MEWDKHVIGWMFIKNTSWNSVDPSTEAKQDDIIAKMPTLTASGEIPVVVENKTDFVVDLYVHMNISWTFTINSNTTIDYP